MDDLDKNTSLSSPEKQSIVEQLRQHLLANPLDNLPSLFLISVSAFGAVTLISLLLIDWLVFPFVLVAIISSLFAAWHIRILGSMKVQIERLTEQNDKLSEENAKFSENNLSFSQKIEQLSDNLTEMTLTVDSLKSNNDRLHQELNALQTLRENLQEYTDETKLDFSQLLTKVNKSFQHLEAITLANERVLLQRIAQDLEFLDHKAGMQQDEYQRFVNRIPKHLQAAFARLNNTSFEQVSGEDQCIDHKELQTLVYKMLEN